MTNTIRVFAILLFASAAFSQPARIQGLVRDDTGKALPTVYVVVTGKDANNHTTRSTLTGSHGEFTIENLPAGLYSVCAQIPGGQHLNACHWSSEDQVTLTPGQALNNHSLTITQGVILKIRIDDPKKLITPADDVMVGIYLPSGIFQPLRLATRDDTGRAYDVSVPKQGTVRLSVISTHVQIADEKGASLAPKGAPAGKTASTAATHATFTIAVPAAVNGPPLVYTVTGRK